MIMIHSEGTPIHQIDNAPNLDEILAKAGSSVVMAKFVADWCGLCKMFKPILDRAVVVNRGVVKLYTVDSGLNGELIKRKLGFLPEKQFSKLL